MLKEFLITFLFIIQIIRQLIKDQQSEIKQVYPGLKCFKDGVREIPISSIPGIGINIK